MQILVSLLSFLSPFILILLPFALLSSFFLSKSKLSIINYGSLTQSKTSLSLLDICTHLSYNCIMPKKTCLIWDNWNTEHIKKHSVTITEIEEVYKNKHKKIQSYSSRNLLLGKTSQGRLLTIILATTSQNETYVVSARDQSKKERKIYEEK